MSILSHLASFLEVSARGLRRMDGEHAKPADAVVPMGTPRHAPAPKRVATLPQPHPLGFWLCTHSTFDDFQVGHAYSCRTMPQTGCMRILPYEGSSWSPYWQPHDGRFCYAAKDLDFVYLGPTLPEGQSVDLRTEKDRIEARFAARRAAIAA